MRLRQIFAILLLAGAGGFALAEQAPAPLPGDEPGTAALPVVEKPAAAPVRGGRVSIEKPEPGARKTAMPAKKAGRQALGLRMAKPARGAVALKVAAAKPAGKARRHR